jgi:hypothetical protein
MPKHLLLIACACAAIATAVTPLASASTGSVIRLTLPGTKSAYVDLGPKGYSAGDYFVSTGRLLDAETGKPVGRLGGVWTILSRLADHAVFDLGLPRGTIFVAGRIVHAAPKSTLSLTGGTGRYRGSRGTVVFRYLSQTTARLELHLRT